MTDDSTAARAGDAVEEPPPFSLALGVGAAWLRRRVQNVEQHLVEELPAGVPSHGSGNDEEAPSPEGIRIDGEGTWLGPPPPEPTYRDDHRAAYPTLSLTLDLQQPLVSIGTLHLRLAERFSIAVSPRVADDDQPLFAGFADVVLGAHPGGFPVQVGVGPTLGVLDGPDELFGWEDPVLVGVVGIVRVQLPGVPGTLDAVVRGTRLLASSAETGSYRDAQLAFSLPL